jgi:hypothetical protein
MPIYVIVNVGIDYGIGDIAIAELKWLFPQKWHLQYFSVTPEILVEPSLMSPPAFSQIRLP